MAKLIDYADSLQKKWKPYLANPYIAKNQETAKI